MKNTPRVLPLLRLLSAALLSLGSATAFAVELQVDTSSESIPGVLTRQDHMKVGSALRLNDVEKLEAIFAKRHQASAMTKKVRKLHKKGKNYLSSADQRILNEALLAEMAEGRECDRQIINALVGLGANAALNGASDTDPASRSQMYQCSTELLIESVAVARDEDERLDRLAALGSAVAEDMIWYLEKGRKHDTNLGAIRNMKRFSGVYNQVSSTLKRECLRNEEMCVAAGSTLAIAQGISTIQMTGHPKVKTAFKGVRAKILGQGRNLKSVAKDQLADFQALAMARGEALRDEAMAEVNAVRDEAMGRVNEAREQAYAARDEAVGRVNAMKDEANEHIETAKAAGKKAKKAAKLAKAQAKAAKEEAKQAQAAAVNAAKAAQAQAAAAAKAAKEDAKKDAKKMLAKSSKKAAKEVTKFGSSLLR